MWTSVPYGQGGEVLPRLYDNHPAKTGSFHQVYGMTGIFSRNILSRLYSLYRRDMDRSMSALTGSCADYFSCIFNPSRPGYDIITWINTYG